MASFTKQEPEPDDVVISGIGGTFPNADNISELEENLFKNLDMTEKLGEYTGDRGQHHLTLSKGTIHNKDKFDSAYFGISHAQARSMDSLVFKVLEKTYEAIIDSGRNPSDLKDTRTAVIIGSLLSESEVTIVDVKYLQGFNILGHCRSLLANRVSYWLNTKGPSFGYYSHEVAGICGITQAYELINTNQCDSAIVGAIDYVWYPRLFNDYIAIRDFSSSDRQCQHDTKEKKFSRSDACVVMYLQRAKDARRIYATVVHSDYYCYGNRNTGLLRPVTEPMLQLLERFYEKCHINPEEISYVETSSCGWKVHDEVEFEAIGKAILRMRESPLLVSSITSNFGSAGSAASLCSIAKVVIAMEKGLIPADIRVSPTPSILAFAEGKLKLVNENTKWNPNLAAVNSIDISGNYGHILLRANTKEKSADLENADGLPRLVCVSGRNEEGLKKNLDKISSMPMDREFVKLVQDIHEENIANHNYRGYTINPLGIDFEEIQHFDGSKRPVWFVFSGMGSQWPGMGAHIMKLPVIAEVFNKCHNVLQPLGLDLLYILTTDDPSIFDNILHSFVGISAVQLALVEVLKLLDIEADGIIGHSVGELGCAYADGCFTLEQMILAAYYRGLASIETELIQGRMAAVGLGYNKVKTLVPPSVDVACHNSGDSSTISGPAEDINAFVEKLKSENIFAREVNVSNIAYHSRYIKPAAPKLLAYLQKIIPDPKLRSSRWYSTSAPRELWETDEARYSSAEYHTNNLLNPVLFEETSQHIPKNAILIEIAPHGLLQAILKRSMDTNISIPLTQRGNVRGLEFLLAAIGKLYIAGKVPRISALYPTVDLPVSRGTPSLSSLVSWDHSKSWQISRKTKKYQSHETFCINLKELKYYFLNDYTINGVNILPISTVLEMVWTTFGKSLEKNISTLSVAFEKIIIYYIPKFSVEDSLRLTLTFQNITGNFEVSESEKDGIFLKGRISNLEDKADEFSTRLAFQTEETKDLPSVEVYDELERNGYQTGLEFKIIQKTGICGKGSISIVKWTENWTIFLDSLLQLAIWNSAEKKQCLYIPRTIQKIVIKPLQPILQNECIAYFNKFTQSVCCGGVEISGIRTEEVPLEKSSSVLPYTFNFVPYKTTRFQSSGEFVDTAVQLLLENVDLTERSTLDVTELVDAKSHVTLESQVTHAITNHTNCKVTVNVLNIDEAKNAELGLLLLASGSVLTQALALLENHAGFLLAEVEKNTLLKLPSCVAVIAEQTFGDNRCILVKKSMLVCERTPVVYMQPLKYFNFQQKCDDTAARNYYFVAEAISVDEVQEFLAHLLKVKNNLRKSYRFVFLADDTPPFSLTSQFFSEQLSLDLVINVYYNGTWGSLRRSEISVGCPMLSSPLRKLMPALRLAKNDWKFVGINLQNLFTEDQECNDLSVLDMSGYSDNGQRVMCLAYMEPGQGYIITDKFLSWSVPDHWSLEDAATVPFPYSLAYYSLVLKSPKYGETILIHAGHSYVGQAFIAVALQLGLEVYTTISNVRQRQLIMNRFPQLQERHIFEMTSKRIEDELLQQTTHRLGFNCVVNFLEEPYLQTSISLACQRGCILQVCRKEMKQMKSLGMAIFLRGVAVNSVIPEMMFEMNTAWKIQLHNLVTEGIKSGVVQPFPKKMYTFMQKTELLRTLHDRDYMGRVVITTNIHDNQLTDATILEKNCLTDRVFIIDQNEACLIIGNEAEDCLMMAEWLVNKGCQNFTIHCDQHTMSNRASRQLQTLIVYHKANIDIRPLEKFHHLERTRDCSEENDASVPFAAVFILPVKESLITFLEDEGGFESCKYLVLLMNSDTSGVAELRRRRGQHVLDVQWISQQKQAKMELVLEQLEDLLFAMPSQTVFLSLKNFRSHELSSSSEQVSLLLPSSIEELEKLGSDLKTCSSSSLVEVCSKCPSQVYVREVHPVYIVPGLQGPAKDIAETLARNLMCPAMVVKLPGGTDNLQENITAIVKDIKQIQSRGPYNIVGVSWGGIYAVELAKRFQAQGERFHIFLVDGAPFSNQEIARNLGEGNQLQINLLTRLLNLSSTKVHKYLSELPDWQSRLHHALNEISPDIQSNKEHLCIAIDSLYSRLKTLLCYKPDETILSDEVTLIRTSTVTVHDICEQQKIFKNDAKTIIVDCSNHKTVLESTEVANIISYNSIVDLYCNKNTQSSVSMTLNDIYQN